MASGRQIAEQNFETFTTWMASKTDADFRQLVSRGVLSRKEIAAECCFAKSALDQNPRVKAALRTLEEGLRQRGVLPALAAQGPQDIAQTPMREPSKLRVAQEVERARRLEQENASLRAENNELKRRLGRYEVLHEALALTGRVPR